MARSCAARDAHSVEIVTWPARGWRQLDAGTGNEAGTTEGVFACEWRGNELFGRNEAVGGHYVVGFRDLPERATPGLALSEGRVLLWHCNYHPDGGQLFWPLDGQPCRAGGQARRRPRARGRSWLSGPTAVSVSIIHPEIWHEGVFPVGPGGRFFDKQGRVHARISCDLAREFGVLLSVQLPQAM